MAATRLLARSPHEHLKDDLVLFGTWSVAVIELLYNCTCMGRQGMETATVQRGTDLDINSPWG